MHTHTYMHRHTHVSMQSHSCVYAAVCISIHTQLHKRAHCHRYTYAYICSHTHACVQTITHTITHTRRVHTRSMSIRLSQETPQESQLTSARSITACSLPAGGTADHSHGTGNWLRCRVENRPLLCRDFISLVWSCLRFPTAYSKCQD